MTRAKVLLIDPTTPYNDQVNLGVVSLASYLDSLGHEARVVDMNFRKEDAGARLDAALAELKPDLVGISVVTYFAFAEVKALAARVKAACGARVVVGGASPSMFPERMLAENPVIDFLVFGEGERTLAELAEALSSGTQDYSGIPGLAWRPGGKAALNAPRPPIADLDTLPRLNFDLVDLVRLYGFRYYNDMYVMATSRGCPYNCSFCLSNVLCGRRWRPFSALRVVDEIEGAVRKYGLTRISFQDDNFVMRPARVTEICRLIRERGLKLKLCLDGGIRADRLTEDSFRELLEAGLERGYLAVESGSPAVFAAMNKGETLEEVERALLLLKSGGIDLQIFMILGLPGDTHEGFLESMAFSRRHGVKCRWHLAFPFEGTAMYGYVQKHGRFLRDCAGYDVDIVSGNDVTTPGTFPLAFDTPEYPAAQRLADYYYAVIESGTLFYVSGAGGRGRLGRLLRSFGLVLRYHPRRLPAYLAGWLADKARALAGRSS